MHRVQTKVGKRLGSVGKWSAQKPWAAIGLCAVTTLLCAPGFLRLTSESRADKLWTEQECAAFDNKRYIDSEWGSSPLPFRIIIQSANTGENALTMDAFRDAFQVVDEVLAVKTKRKTFTDICARWPTGECVRLGPLRFLGWNHTTFEAKVSNDNELLGILSSEIYPDNGEQVSRDDIFGRLETSGSQITSAGVWRIDFIVDHEKDEDLAWRRAVTNLFVSDDFAEVEQRWPNIHVEVWDYASSTSDELERNVSGDITFMVWAYNFLIVSCSVLLGPPLKCVQGRRVLGACDFLMVLAASACGYGLGSAFGVPFVSIHQILPFILVGIGVDNSYVLVGGFDRTDPTLPTPDRMRLTLEEAGMSITLTSATSVAAFLIGSSAAFPAVSHFCVYAGLSLVFIYAFHITGFCAMIALDQRRQEAGRLDCLCCVRRRASGEISPEPQEYFSQRMMEKYTRAITSHIVIKLTIIGAFLGLSGFCLWQAIEKTDTNFAVLDLAADSSYMRNFMETEMDYWGGDSTNLNARVNLFFRDVDLSNADVQAQIAKTEDELLDISCINEQRGITSWHRSFSSWARLNKDTPPNNLWARGDFKLVDGQEFLAGPSFHAAVQHWLGNCSLGCSFGADIMWDDNIISASRVSVVQSNLPVADEQAACLTEIEDFNEKSDEELPGTFAFYGMHIFYHAYRMIRQELLFTIGICFVCVLIVASFMITHPAAVLIIFCVIFLVFVDLLGSIPILSVSLNSISLVNLVMAIGLVVDYSMHIVHCFMMQDPALSRNERTVIAMKEMGVSVGLGIFSTFMAVLPLGFATSEVFRVFFKMFVAILVFGGSHGLILMPVILSLVGPASMQIHDSDSRRASEEQVVATDSAAQHAGHVPTTVVKVGTDVSVGDAASVAATAPKPLKTRKPTSYIPQDQACSSMDEDEDEGFRRPSEQDADLRQQLEQTKQELAGKDAEIARLRQLLEDKSAER